MNQFTSWLVCQICGRAAPRNAVAHWLDQPHKNNWDVRIQRCPQHWSDNALRQTRAGRTKANRDAMAEAKKQPPPPIPVFLDPFPTTDREVK